MTKYRLQISDRVNVRVRGELKAAAPNAAPQKVDFTLDMKRVDQAGINELIQRGDSIADTLVGLTGGWEGQNLVIDTDTGAPAAYSPEAMRVLLGCPGMAPLCWASYVRDVGVAEKN